MSSTPYHHSVLNSVSLRKVHGPCSDIRLYPSILSINAATMGAVTWNSAVYLVFSVPRVKRSNISPNPKAD